MTRSAATARRDPGQRPNVLLVEDNPADLDLTREALGGTLRSGSVHVARDGLAAVAFLRREGPHADAPVPDLVMLDLNLPGLDGLGVLDEMRQDAALRHIPVVVLTSSSAPNDAASAYASGANCFVTKPVGLTEYLAAVGAIGHFWFGVATLPP